MQKAPPRGEDLDVTSSFSEEMPGARAGQANLVDPAHADGGRFGSHFGDNAIRTYRKLGS